MPAGLVHMSAVPWQKRKAWPPSPQRANTINHCHRTHAKFKLHYGCGRRWRKKRPSISFVICVFRCLITRKSRGSDGFCVRLRIHTLDPVQLGDWFVCHCNVKHSTADAAYYLFTPCTLRDTFSVMKEIPSHNTDLRGGLRQKTQVRVNVLNKSRKF